MDEIVEIMARAHRDRFWDGELKLLPEWDQLPYRERWVASMKAALEAASRSGYVLAPATAKPPVGIWGLLSEDQRRAVLAHVGQVATGRQDLPKLQLK